MISSLRKETNKQTNKQTNSLALVRKLTTLPSDRRLSANLVPTFADRGRRVISATDPHGRNLGFLDRIRKETRQQKPRK
jgi:hypothetical protein